MSELENIFRQVHPLPIERIAKWFREKHINLLFSDLSEFFDELLALFSQKPANYTKKDWEQILLIGSIYTIATNPPPSLIQAHFPKDSHNGYYLVSTLFLMFTKQHSTSYLDQLFKFYQEHFDTLFPMNPNPKFYEITSSFYFLDLPQLLGESLFKSPYVETFPNLFTKISKLKAEQINYSTLLFINKIFEYIETATLSTSKPLLISKDLISALGNLITLSPKFPSVFLLFFFEFYIYLTQNFKEIVDVTPLTEKLPIVINLFKSVSIAKYYELHSSFPWYICIYLIEEIPEEEKELKKTLLTFICHGIRTLDRMDNYSRITESIRGFSSYLLNLFFSNEPYLLFYYLTSLNSSLGALSVELSKIYGAFRISLNNAENQITHYYPSPSDTVFINRKDNKKKNEKYISKILSFSDQCGVPSKIPFIDNYLYTKTFQRVYENEKECASHFNYLMHICEKIRNRLHSLVVFHLQICLQIRVALRSEYFNPHQQSQNLSNLYTYLLDTYEKLIDFLILASHKQTELQTFSNHPALTNENVNEQYVQYIPSPQNLLNVNNIFQDYFGECISQMPETFLDSLARMISNLLLHYIEKGLISYHFLINFNLVQPYRSTPTSFWNLIIRKMMETVSLKLSMLFSSNIDDVKLFSAWIAFIIEFTTFMSKGPNITFGLLLNSYKRTIISAVFSELRMISHQSVVVQMLKMFLTALHDNYTPNNSELSNRPRICFFQLDEIDPTALLDTIDVFFDIYLDEPHLLAKSSPLPFLDVAFKSEQKELIIKAAKISAKLFSTDKPTQLSESEESIFSMMVASIHIADRETVEQIVSILPYYSYNYLNTLQVTRNRELFTIDVATLDLLRVLQASTEHLNNSQEEADHLFALVNSSFDIVFQQITSLESNVLSLIISHLILGIKHLFGFQHLESSLNSLISHLTIEFGNLFVRNVSNLYLLCIFNVCGINRSQTTAKLIDLVIAFFEYCSPCIHDTKYLSTTIDDLFSFFPTSTKIFSILNAFSTLVRFYPQLISLNHIRGFLIQATNVHPLDESVINMFNSFLKKYLNTQDQEKLQSFVSMVYEIICPLSMPIRVVLEKRVAKLEIALPIPNLDSILSIADPVIMYQKLTLAFLCGINGNLFSCLTYGLVEQTKSFLKSSDDILPRLEKFARILSVCISILRNKDVFAFYKSHHFDGVLIQTISNIIMVTFPTIQNQVHVCFKILYRNYRDLLLASKFFHNFLNNPHSIFNFWDGDPNRILFYLKLAKIIPQQIPTKLILSFFNEINNYAEKSEIDQMTYLPNFLNIIQFSSIKEILLREQVQAHLQVDKSIIEKYIKTILKLCQHKIIPFKSLLIKHVLPLFTIFPQQTIHYLATTMKNINQINTILLHDWIIEDQSTVLFEQFIAELTNPIDKSNPDLYQLLVDFSVNEKLRNSNRLFQLVYDLFANAINNDKQSENSLFILTSISRAYLNLLPLHFEKVNIFYFSFILKNHFFNYSDLYKKFVRMAFSHLNSPAILFNLFQAIMQTVSKQDTNISLNLANILLPNSIKTLMYIPIKPEKEHIYVGIWELLFRYLENHDRIPSILKSMKYMMDVYLPNEAQQLRLFKAFQEYMNSDNPQVIIYTLKLCAKFADKLNLPKEIFEGILMEIFSYDTFFKEPFYDHVLNLILKCPQYIENLSPKTLETIYFFFHNQFIQIDEFQRILLKFTIRTKIYKLLPFSYLSSICRLFQIVLKKVKHEPDVYTEEFEEIKEIILFILPIFIESETSENEKKFMHRTCFKCLEITILYQQLSSEPDNIQEIIEKFFNLLDISSDITFPKKLLIRLNQEYQGHINDSISFGVVCLGLKYETLFTLLQFPHFIVSAIEYIQIDIRHISDVLLTFFVTFFFNKEQQKKHSNYSVYSMYKDRIKSLLFHFLDRIDEKTFDKYIVIVRIYIEAHFDSSYWKLLTKLLSIFERLDKNSTLSNLFLNGFFNLINFIPFDEQVKYINLVFKTCSKYWNYNMKKIFTKNLCELLSSPTVTNQAKKYLLDLSYNYIEGTANELFELIQQVREFGGQSGFQVTGTTIFIYIIILNQGDPKTNFYCFEQLDDLLGPSAKFEQRLLLLIDELPISLWSDDYFIYIICLLTEKVKVWFPLMAYPQKLKTVAANFAIPTLLMNINDDIIDTLRQFVTNSILKLKYTYSFNQFLTLIEYVFTNTIQSYKLSFFMSIWSAVPPSFNISSWKAQLQMEDFCFDKFIYPNTFNDSLIHHFMSNGNELQNSAVYLTDLAKYEAAEHLYQTIELTENSFFEMKKEFNRLFLKPQKNTFTELIQPILKPNGYVKTVIFTLEKSFNAFLRGEKEESLILLQTVRNQLLDDYTKHLIPSFYQKIRLIAIETLSLMMKKAMKNEELTNFDSEPYFSSLNSSVFKMLKTFQCIIYKQDMPINEVKICPTDEPPFVFISPSIYNNLEKVSGITHHNFYALNSTQVNDFLIDSSRKLSGDDFNVFNWLLFASFCFSIFVTQPTLDLFSTTYLAYCQILTSKENTDILIRNEASSRIITLIRIATRQDVSTSFQNPIISHSFIFKHEYAKIWRFWLQELIELANNNWFYQISKELFSEMAYRSTLYASKYTSIDIQRSIEHNIIHDRGSGQISMMTTIARILNHIASIELEELCIQSRFKAFVEESLKLSSEELSEINLISLREDSLNITPFEKALSFLTKPDIEKFGDFHTWISNVRDMKHQEREKCIQILTNSSQSYSALYTMMSNDVDDFNNQMPFIFSTPTETIGNFSVYFMHKHLKALSPDMVSFTATTSLDSNQHFLLLGTKNSKGFSATVMSISHIFTIIRFILRHSYSTVIRKISLANHNFFEMGPRAIMMWFGSEPTSFQSVFERDMMITSKDWIKKCVDEKTDTLNQNGHDSIKQFPVDSLIKSAQSSLKSYIQAYQGLAVSFASLSVVRYMLSAPYPDIGQLMINNKSFEFPILSTDFDNVDITQNTTHANFRFSPNIEYAASIWGNTGLKVAIAAVANALTENINVIRSHLEIIIGDQIILRSTESPYDSIDPETRHNNFTIDDLIQKRTIVENRFIELSPPSRPTSIENSTGWLNNITEIVEKAKNPWIQPVTKIPWF